MYNSLSYIIIKIIYLSAFGIQIIVNSCSKHLRYHTIQQTTLQLKQKIQYNTILYQINTQKSYKLFTIEGSVTE